MTDIVNIHAAKTHLSQLLKRVSQGEEIVIARAGVPLARLVPIPNKRQARIPGLDRDKVSIADDFDERLDMDCIKVLAISHAHACLIADLPPIHRDPFDRLLIAQAMHEGLPLISGNQAIRSYPIDVIW